MSQRRSRRITKSLPRDEIVARGRESRGKHDHPWEYKAMVKSGRSRTQRVEKVAYNVTDLIGQIIEENAAPGEDLFAWNISKILKRQSRSRRDY